METGDLTTVVTMEAIQKVVRQIVERFHPRKVVLFGSYAYGTPTSDSDVDLLVVMETKGNPLHMAATISAAIDHPFPLDILVYTPHRLQASLERNGSFASQLAKGLTLYET
jgi:predicted nucleotidyltransferase